MKHYLILEEGSYSDYSVSFLEILPEWTLSEGEVIDLLNSSYSDYKISGHIYGALETNMEILDLQKETEYRINRLFGCFEHSSVSSILDRWYGRKECLEIALRNYPSEEAYWYQHIDYRYAQYQKVYALYRKLMRMSEK